MNSNYKLADNQYYKEETPKRVIVIHHTAGGQNPINVLHGWNYTPEKVGTAYVIAGKEDKTKSYKEGEIFQAFDEKYWAHHLGCKTANNGLLNMQSIGIEICNWGQLLEKDGKFYNYVNGEVPKEEVVTLVKPFKTFIHYHKYSDAQIDSLKYLLIALGGKYNIPLHYNENIFDLNQEALAGKGGLFCHVSYRTDKFDCSPQPNLIKMLQSL